MEGRAQKIKMEASLASVLLLLLAIDAKIIPALDAEEAIRVAPRVINVARVMEIVILIRTVKMT